MQQKQARDQKLVKVDLQGVQSRLASVSNNDRSRTSQRTGKRQGDSDREETVSDPRCYRRKLLEELKITQSTAFASHQPQSRTPEKTSNKQQRKKASAFPKIVFKNNSASQAKFSQDPSMAAKNNSNCASQTDADLTKPTSSTQIESTNQEKHTQTELSMEVKEIYE